MKKKNKNNNIGLKIGGVVIVLVLLIKWGNTFFQAKDTFTPQPKQQSQSTPKKQTKSARSNSSEITFDKCFNTDDFNSYTELFNSDDSFDSSGSRWYWKINISKGKAVRTMVHSDEEIKYWEKAVNITRERIELDSFQIDASTNEYVTTRVGPDGIAKYAFNLNTGEINLNIINKRTGKIMSDQDVLIKCEIYR